MKRLFTQKLQVLNQILKKQFEFTGATKVVAKYEFTQCDDFIVVFLENQEDRFYLTMVLVKEGEKINQYKIHKITSLDIYNHYIIDLYKVVNKFNKELAKEVK